MKMTEIIKSIKYSILKTIRNSADCRVLWAVISTLILMNSCTTKDIVRDWNSGEEHKRSVESIMIMGLVNQVSLRSDIEYEMSNAAHKIGLKATNSIAMFPPELGKPFDDTERIKVRMHERGIDAILTVAIIDIKAERYVGPEKTYVPLAYYDRFTNYYYRTEAVVYKPGYFTLQTRYFLETNLYEIKGGKLIWSGRSYVFDPQDVERFVPKYAKKLFKEMLTAGIIDK
jgi:hypothetical protein